MLYLCEIHAIHPGRVGDASDETWFARTIVRTFKLSGETYADIERSADALLAAWLEANPGQIGSPCGQCPGACAPGRGMVSSESKRTATKSGHGTDRQDLE